MPLSLLLLLMVGVFVAIDVVTGVVRVCGVGVFVVVVCVIFVGCVGVIGVRCVSVVAYVGIVVWCAVTALVSVL